MPDKELVEKERTLERLKADSQIADTRREIAERRALENEARQKYGKNWRKILGMVKSIRPDMDTVHTLYSQGLGDLKDKNDPSKWRKDR